MEIATAVGAMAGGLAFGLISLFFGVGAGVVLALIATLLAFWRERLRSAVAFALGGVAVALSLIARTPAVFIGALAFAIGLALVASVRGAPDEADSAATAAAPVSRAPTSGAAMPSDGG
ncbi:MAG TPA: hypothetical protein VEI06_11745 [Gemmatimonadaceae bacterium]|nr:hypothetical protein [Gemmatimonadaceae bacterium]